jgi:hypothetical protein
MNHDLLKMADTATAALDTDATVDQVLMAMDFVKALKEATAALAERVESRVIGWIEANGEIEHGDTRYYVAPNKTTKCKDLGQTLEAVLKATGGDFGATVRAFSSSAFKPGACRELLPADEYEALFETKEAMDLKEGKPKPARLQRADTRFLK